jgi:hypothetical protein
MKGALQALFTFKRPHLVMNIGPMLPAVNAKVEGMSRKAALEDGANQVMAAVSALIPTDEKTEWVEVLDERFDFRLAVHHTDADGSIIDEREWTVSDPEALGRFFHRPVILDVMARNMRLPVRPLQRLGVEHDPTRLADALAVVNRFFAENPHFLGYRFGYDEAEAMTSGVQELYDLTRQAAVEGYKVTFKPIRTYRKPGSEQEVIEVIPGMMHEM